MRILILFCFAGLAYGFQPNLRYKYHYQGISETGIPQINNEGAAVGIKFDAFLDVSEDGHAVIQFKDIYLAERHGCLHGCDRTDPFTDKDFVPITSSEFKETLERPFDANIYGKEDYSMRVETEEILWLRNIRRAIVGLFRNSLLKANFDLCTCKFTKHIKETKDFPKVFSLNEKTILGYCEVHYTVHKIEGMLAEIYNDKLEKNTEVDVQRDHMKYAEIQTSKKTYRKYSSKKARKSSKHGKGHSKYIRKESIPELENDLYHVTRTINFDNCKDTVALRHSSIRFDDDVGKSTYSWFGERSSVSEYFFRGSGGALRMETAIVDGSITYKSLGMADERMSAFTNQTLHLKSVEEVSHPMKVSESAVSINGWMQEVLSPFKVPQISDKTPWINYMSDESMVDKMEMMTGIKQTKEEMFARKTVLKECLNSAAKAFAAEHAQDEVDPVLVMENLKVITIILEAMPKDSIMEIVEEIMAEDSIRPEELYKKIILVDSLVASGSKRTMLIVLNLIKTKKLSDIQALFISATAMTSLFEVSAIPDIVDFAMEISLKEKPFLSSTTLINVANMIHHYCVVPAASKNNYAGAFYGDYSCHLDYLEEKFIPYLRNILADESKTWERIVVIKVLGKLGMPLTIKILGPVALGQKGSEEQLRIAAITSLSRWKLHYSNRDHAMQILSEIYTNIGEFPRLRSVALVTYTSWGPEPAFFSKLAKLSWREPSAAVGALYSSVIQAFAETNNPKFTKQNKAACHAIKLARPVSPSMRYPFIFKDFKLGLNTHESEIEEDILMHFNYPEPKINFDAYSFLMNSVNGFHTTIMEMDVNSGGIGEFIQNTFMKNDGTDIHTKVINDLYHKIQDVIKADPTSSRMPLVTAYWRIFDNMQFLFPISKETIESSHFFDPAYLASVLLELQTGLTRSIGKFLTLANFRELLVNEMGLPVYTSNTGHIVFSNTFNARLSLSTNSMQEPPKKAHLFIENYERILSECSGEIDIIVPWSNSKISTIVRSTRGLTNPFLATFDGDATKMRQPKLQFTFESAYNKKYSILKAKTFPQTRIDTLSFTGKTRQPSVLIPVKHNNIKKVIQLPQTYSGLAYTVIWDSQFRYPFDFYGFNNLIKNCDYMKPTSEVAFLLSSQTAQFWSLELQFDPEKSETKNVTMGLTFQLAGKDKENDEMSQVSQTAGELDYGQQEFTEYGQEQFDSGNQEFQEVDLSVIKNHGGVNINDNFQQKSAKMTEHYGGKANTVGLTLGYYGDKTREYELFYSWSKPDYAKMRKKVKSQLTFLRSPIPGKDHKSLSVCVDSQIVTPVLRSFDTLESLFDRNLDTEITRTLTPNCEGKPLISVESVIKMSPGRIEKMRKEIKHDCKFDSFDPVHTFYNTVYDDIRAKITWEDLCDKNRLPILTKVIDFLDRVPLVRDLYISKCEMKDTANQVDFHVHRCTESDLWYFSITRDSFVFKVDALPSNEIVDFLLSLRIMSAEKMKDFTEHSESSSKCVIQHGKVRTFDGVVYDYEPTPCWTVAAKDCKSDSFLVLVRSSTTESTVPEVRIIDRENSLFINHIRGEKPDDRDYSDYYSKHPGIKRHKVIKHNEDYVIILPGKVQVTITDHVQIKSLTEAVCGICGTRDYEKMLEFVGPKHCIYVKPEHFVTSWTGGGETCNLYDALEKRTEVEEYQKTCESKYALFKKAPTYQPMYTEYVWHIEEMENNYCISREALPQCPEGFFSLNSNMIHASFNCWNKKSAPPIIQSSLESGHKWIFSTVHFRPTSTKISLVQIDVLCVQYPK